MTIVRAHMRRGTKGVVSHRRMVRSRSSLGRLMDKRMREEGINSFSKKNINYDYDRVKELTDPHARNLLEMRHEQFVNGPLGSILNKKLSYEKEEFDPKRDRFVTKVLIPFPQVVGIGTRTPYADSVLEKHRHELNTSATYRKKLKDLYLDNGELDSDDVNKLYYEYLDEYFKKDNDDKVWVEKK
jgi:hypothetical protein